MKNVALILMLVAVVQWLLFAAISSFSRAKYPKKGIRTSERNLLVSSLVLLGLWLVGFDVQALLRSQTKTPVVQATVTPMRQTGSCASIRNEATAAEVKRLMGEPDETRSNEETRGPGSAILVYRGSRCAVHIFDDRVEFVE